ncbi:MAG: DUF192 domain-containing protein [Xylophilus ampelinus]
MPTLQYIPRSNAVGAVCLFLQLLLASAIARAQDTPQMNLERTVLQAGMHRIDAQVAQTPTEREIGLMQRKSMPQHEGMLFVFPEAGVQCFWMKNTVLPLTAAFVADDGTIVNLADMQPMTTDSHCSAQPVRFVLEMNKGWFARVGYKAGSKLGGPPFTR